MSIPLPPFLYRGLDLDSKKSVFKIGVKKRSFPFKTHNLQLSILFLVLRAGSSCLRLPWRASHYSLVTFHSSIWICLLWPSRKSKINRKQRLKVDPGNTNKGEDWFLWNLRKKIWNEMLKCKNQYHERKDTVAFNF